MDKFIDQKREIFAPIRNLKRLYVITIAAVTGLTIAGGIIIQRSLEQQSFDAKIINIAGRQRMLSQKLTKTSILLNQAVTPQEQQKTLDELTTIVDLWRTSHEGLKSGNEELELPGRNSETVTAMFEEMQPYYEAMISASTEILQQQQPNPAAIAAILNNENQFLTIMNEIVFQYEAEANQRLQHLKLIQLLLLIVTVFVVLPLLIPINNITQSLNHLYLELSEAKKTADAASVAKSNFLANMSHELRTPLNGVMGYAQVLQNSNDLPETAKEKVSIIFKCAHHLLTLINDILDISKIEADKLELNPTDFYLPAFLQSVVEICQIRADLKKIDFIYKLDPHISVGVKADEKRLRQVLINLLNNAIKFTPERGQVRLLVQAQSEPNHVKFAVQDSGVGIPPEQLEKIFQPFEQADNQEEQKEGTGLGLTISQKILHLMGSEIQVRSQVNQGSEFWFEVPLPRVEHWEQSAQQDKFGKILGIKDGRYPLILIVDDKWENRSVLVSLLEPIGFTLIEASNGEEGYKSMAQYQPDLIITDLMMPKMNGFELITKIREEDQTIPILASSASVFEADQQRSIEVGATTFLSKPIDAKELMAKVKHYLNLEWEYGKSSPEKTQVEAEASTKVVFNPPPQAMLDQIYDLASKGNMKGLVLYLDQEGNSFPGTTNFAQQVKILAQNFDDEAIMTLVEEYR